MFFQKEQVQKRIVAMSISEAYLGTNRINHFHLVRFESVHSLHKQPTHYRSSNLNNIQQKNTLDALDFVLITSYGINLANYDKHYVVAFDLTSNQEASKDLIHPELTNYTILVELIFDACLSNYVKL